jgi:hypothetical protein
LTNEKITEISIDTVTVPLVHRYFYFGESRKFRALVVDVDPVDAVLQLVPAPDISEQQTRVNVSFKRYTLNMIDRHDRNGRFGACKALDGKGFKP